MIIMNILDIIEIDPQKIIDLCALLNISVSSKDAEVIALVIYWLSVLAILVGLTISAWKGLQKICEYFFKDKRWKDNYIQTRLEHEFGDYLKPENIKNYIPTQSQGVPPYDFDEPSEAVAGSPRQDLVSMFVDDVFNKNNTNRQLYCILAGSGMGKTTFAVQLLICYVKKYKAGLLPFEIYIMNLANPKIFDKIRTLTSDIKRGANQSILILDALDENLQAAEDFDTFKNDLETLIEPYKFVVITCRSQFFPDEKSEPSLSSIKNNTREKNLIRYNKIYICPFSPSDIEEYVKRKYKRKERPRALSIINKCKSLMARPLLLSYIDDLLNEDEEYQYESDIYETLIRKWIQREVNAIKEIEKSNDSYDELQRFSKLLAIKFYQNWKKTGEYKLSDIELNAFCQQYQFDVRKYQFKGRSLINHDAYGAYKFAHKSFLEYFLAKEYFLNKSFEFSFEGMDMAESFYAGFCKQEYREMQKHNIFRIESIRAKSNDYMENDITLTIAQPSKFDYHHLLYVIYPGRFDEIIINWKAYDKNVQEFIEDSGVNSISITNYKRGLESPKSILKSPYISFVSIKGEELPKSFVKEASSRGIHVFHNDVTIVRGTRKSDITSLYMQLRMQLDLQTEMFRIKKMKESEMRMNKMLVNEVNKEKEG